MEKWFRGGMWRRVAAGAAAVLRRCSTITASFGTAMHPLRPCCASHPAPRPSGAAKTRRPPAIPGLRLLGEAFIISQLLLAAGSASAMEYEDITQRRPTRRMGPVIVTARRAEEPLSSSVENIMVLDAEYLRNLPVHDPGEAMGFIPGIAVQPNGGIGRVPTITVHGSLPRQVRMMVDGILFNTQGEGSANITQLPLENVERIEILKGPASAAWGSALGGVVNIITKDPPADNRPRGRIGGATGAYGSGVDYLQGLFELGGRQGQASWYSAGSWSKDDGFRPRSDVEQMKGFLKGVFPVGESRLKMFGGYSRADMGDFEHTPFNLAQDVTSSARYGAMAWSSAPADTRVEISAKTSDQISDRRSFSLDPYALLGSTHVRDVYRGVDAVITTDMKDKGTLVLGADAGWDGFNAGDGGGDRKGERKAGYGNLAIGRGDFTFQGGMRYDTHSDFGEAWSPSGGIGWRMPWIPVRLRGTVSRDFNAPPLVYRYVDTPALAPNAAIRAERAIAWGLGADGTFSRRWTARMDVFLVNVRDAIRFETQLDGRTAAVNGDREERTGVEGEIGFKIANEWAATAGASYLNVEDGAGAVIEGGGRPRMTQDLGLYYNHPRGFGGALRGHYVWWNVPDADPANDRKFIWDVKLTQTFSNKGSGDVASYLTVTNLFNSSHGWNALYPMPGRFVEAGMEYRF
ncbi:MAG: TonB-dependent receptor plug domain-containing protein [Planctomycetota bacterium]